MIAAIVAMVAAAAAAQAAPVTTADAIAYFRHVCVDTLPDPSRFAAALAEPGDWEPFEKNDRGARVIGHFWRSARGELGYLYLPGMRAFQTDPACHYSFRTDAGYSHAEARAALARALGLDAGRETGNARAPQTRWETRLPNGTRARLFLSSAVPELGEPAARLSISAYPVAHPSE
jgi:hypothetical protein